MFIDLFNVHMKLRLFEKVFFEFNYALLYNNPTRLVIYDPAFLSAITKHKVANGPRNKDKKNQLSPLRFFPWANPALIRARVPHPTKYSFSI